MAINISQAFHRTSAAAIDDTLTLTKAEMLTVNDNLMPAKYLTVCQDDGKIYLYDKSATPSQETGKFSVFEGGGTPAGGGDSGLVYKQTLAAGATTLTFSNLSLSKDTRVKLYSSPFVLGLISNVAQTSNSITLTCAAQSNDVSVMIEVVTPSDVTPNGKTVTPTDDVSIWLKCADIKNKSYTELSEVLEDNSTLTKLISSTNAVDYLKRSVYFATDICADSNAMSLIGANDYCADELLSNSTWLNAICNSTYFESVLNSKVPTMTSDTTPSGKVISTNIYSVNPAYYAFDGKGNTCAAPNAANTPFYVGYMFTSPICVNKLCVNCRSGYQKVSTYYLQASNNDTDWEDLTVNLNMTSGNTDYYYYVPNTTKYTYYRVYTANLQGSTQGFNTIQFYGRS